MSGAPMAAPYGYAYGLCERHHVARWAPAEAVSA